jgi:hypothetical protein
MTYLTIVIVFWVICLGVTMIVVERLRQGQREWNTRCGLGEKSEHRLTEVLIGIDVWRRATLDVEWRRLPVMRAPRFLI